MNFQSYLKPLTKYWWLILAAGIVAVVTSFVVTLFQQPVYQTQATLVVGRMLYEANPSSNDIYLGQQLANYYAEIGMRGDVYNSTQTALGLTWLPEYTITPLPNSQLMEIVVVDSNPARAQAVANELANQLILRSPTANEAGDSDQQSFINEQVHYLEEKIRDTLDEIDAAELILSQVNSAQQIADAQEEIAALQNKLYQLQSNYAALISNTGEGAINTLSVIERAPLPTTPVGPNKFVTIIIAGFVAAMLAAVAAYVLELVDDTLKAPEEITDLLAIPVLGSISNMVDEGETGKFPSPTPVRALLKRIEGILKSIKKPDQTSEPEGKQAEEVIVHAANFPGSSVSEEFRSLRINLDFASVDKPLKTILVTSPSPAEGKSSIASNLAIVMAQGGKKVVLLDVDFRKPKVHRPTSNPDAQGLSDVLRGSLEIRDILQPWEENLRVVNTGMAPPNPVDLLSSQRMGQILEQLSQMTDVVIIDGPPLIFPDSLALSPKVDGVLVIFRYGFTRRGTAQTHIQHLTQIGARVIGAVLNAIPFQHTSYYNNYYYYSHKAIERSPESEGKRVN